MQYFVVIINFYFVFLRFNAYADDADNNCTIYRDNLASALSTFTACALQHSRPITLCESCVDVYIDVLDSFHNFSTFKNGDDVCINDYVNLDRLQIVETLYRNAYDLWQKAKCYECFTLVNNTLTHNRSMETETFNSLLNATMKCIHETKDDQTIFCTYCMDSYLELNSYYISISNINEKIGVCMDIVDLMNGTRSMWSKKCCEYRRNKEYIFLGSTAVVSLITVLFYILAKLCTDMKKPEIFRQSRFAESLNPNSSTSLNCH